MALTTEQKQALIAMRNQRLDEARRLNDNFSTIISQFETETARVQTDIDALDEAIGEEPETIEEA